MYSYFDLEINILVHHTSSCLCQALVCAQVGKLLELHANLYSREKKMSKFGMAAHS